MANRHEDAGVIVFYANLLGKMDDGLSLFIIEDFNVVPGQFGAKSGAKRLGNRFFCAKTAGKMGRRVLEFVAIILLALREEAIQKMEAMPFDAGANAIDF